MILAIAGFLGGLIRGLMGFVSHGKGKVNLAWFLVVIILEGIVGMIFSLAINSTGIFANENLTALLVATGLAGYMGADITNSIYKVLFRRRMDL